MILDIKYVLFFILFIFTQLTILIKEILGLYPVNFLSYLLIGCHQSVVRSSQRAYWNPEHWSTYQLLGYTR